MMSWATRTKSQCSSLHETSNFRKLLVVNGIRRMKCLDLEADHALGCEFERHFPNGLLVTDADQAKIAED